ncbi:hypothetical protein F01_490090 [Burkholderia cenocepacia]|nr:hypothetical protein F01_490090 [Burkholderia cenocepacia]
MLHRMPVFASHRKRREPDRSPVLTLIKNTYHGEKFRILLNRYRLAIVARFPARIRGVRRQTAGAP